MDRPPPPRFNAWPLAGLTLGLFGLLSYFFVFAAVPLLRDTAALNLLLVLLGLGVAAWGLRLALRRGGPWRIAGSALALLLAAGCAALLSAYVFSLSKQLPEPSAASIGLDRAPSFTLTAQDGRSVSLSDFAGRRVLLVFYRGWW